MSTLLAFLFLCALTTVWAQAPIASTPDVPVGIVSDPCKGVPTPPPPPPGFMNAMMEARKKGTPPPPPPPELMAALKKFQVELMQLDFAGLCRYEAANGKLPPPTDHRVVLLGDSITEGWGRVDPKLFSEDIINRGISAQTSTQMLVRFRADVLNLRPKVVHLLVGTNDVAGNGGPTTLARIEGAIASMVEQARAAKVEVLIGSVLPAKDFGWRPTIKPVEQIAELNAWLKDYAKANGLVYIDYYSEMEDEAHGLKTELTIDGVHPNEAGYAIMKKLLLKSLEGKLGKGTPVSAK